MPPITFISPDGRQLVDSRGETDDSRLRAMGYHAVDRQDVTRKIIEKNYNTWKDDAEAIGIGAMQGLPGLTGTIEKLLPESAAQKLAAQINAESIAHPILTTAAQLGTGAALISATGGLGAAALETTGAVGTAAFLQTAAFNAAGSVAMGAGTRFDARAVRHALSPAGEEKINAETGHEWLIDAAIGAAIPVVSGVAAKAFRGLAKVAEETRNSQIQKSILDQVKMSEAQYAGRQSEIWQMVEGNNWHNMPHDKVSLAVKNQLSVTAKQMEAIEKTATQSLRVKQGIEYADLMGNYLADNPKLAKKIVDKSLAGELSVKALGEFRQKLRESINWIEFAKNPAGQQNLVDAHELTSRTINGLLQQNDPLLADSWMNANKQYSDLALLQGVFKQGKVAGPVSNSMWKDIAMITGIGRVLGWAKAAMWAVQGKNITRTFEKFANGGFAETAQNLTQVFDRTSQRFSNAILENFHGLAMAPQVVRDVETAKPEKNYDVVAAAITTAAKNTELASANIMHAYTKAGMPDELAARFTQQALAKNSFLASKLPQPSGASLGYIMPSDAQPSPQQQQNFFRYYDAIHDPVSVLKNPTSEGLETMQNFYPDLLQSTQNHVFEYARSGAPLTLQQQKYAAAILGTPVSSLTDPSTYRNMQTARQMVSQQQAAKQAQLHQQTRSNASVSDSDLTTAQRLARR